MAGKGGNCPHCCSLLPRLACYPHHSFSLALGEPQPSATGHPEIAGLLPPSRAELGSRRAPASISEVVGEVFFSLFGCFLGLVFFKFFGGCYFLLPKIS